MTVMAHGQNRATEAWGAQSKQEIWMSYMADKLAIILALAHQAGPSYEYMMKLPEPAPQVTITRQMGGDVAAHARRVVDYYEAGTRVRVTGACVSACALITALPADRICVGPNARFGLHQPWHKLDRPGAVSFAVSDLGNAIAAAYPAFIQRWLTASHHGLPHGPPVYIHYDELRKHYTTCR